VADYFKHKNFKDKTFFLCEQPPVAWEVKQETFEGEGGLHSPSGLQQALLQCGDARYETPAAIVQYRLELADSAEHSYRFIFGPAFDDAEIQALRKKFLSAEGFALAQAEYAAYIASGSGCLQIQTPDAELDNFVNNWLPRQVFYHGDVNRLTTDPQTRNYLQDNMGMTYIKPGVTRAAFLHALSQQEASGAMPDGILLTEGAELKYINQIPHTDHCVWLPVCLKAYLDETNDYALLDEPVAHADTGEVLSVFERITASMRWLLQARDYRGLSFIAQGDWCDPMNMVGYKGKGVSGWLSVATAYALNLWADVCAKKSCGDIQQELRAGAEHVNAAVNKYLWDGEWFGRGITDDDVVFGVSKDKEGRIFLNPQSWAILGGAASEMQRAQMIAAVEQQLETPYGVTMFAPAFTAMRDDVGRVTQKHPGSAENGSVYNHAAIFYIFSLYSVAEKDRAFKLLRQMIPGPDEQDYLQRGQLPVYIPNYYRGAYHQYPRTAGRSSQLFNTGTVSWVYRCIIEGIFGLQGDEQGLRVAPQLPAHWPEARVQREFRGAHFDVTIRRADVVQTQLTLDGVALAAAHVAAIDAGKHYRLEVLVPR
jgi:cellobionic acid phosphorylase